MISKDTTAKEVVIQAIREFAVTATPDQYSLCEVSVTPEGVIKQRRLPDQLSKLADRIQLSGRYTISILLDFFTPSSNPCQSLKDEHCQRVFKMSKYPCRLKRSFSPFTKNCYIKVNAQSRLLTLNKDLLETCSKHGRYDLNFSCSPSGHWSGRMAEFTSLTE